MQPSIAYLNGEWVSGSELAVPVSDLGFLLGATVAERLRTFSGQLFRVEDHLARLYSSLQIVGLDAADICQEVSEVLDEFVDRNSEWILEGDDWNVIVFVTPGRSNDTSQPTICVHGKPLSFDQWAHLFEQGVETAIVESRQVPANCWPSELKCRSRMHYYLADQEAAQHGPATRPILLDQEGFISEGSTANVVAYFREWGLVTPYISKVLPGVSQQVLFELGESLGFAHHQRDMLPEDLAEADEVFFASTSICMLPIVKLNDQPIGTGRPGPVYGQLLSAWSERVKVDIAEQAQKFALR